MLYAVACILIGQPGATEKTKLRIAGAQIAVRNDVAANVAAISRAIEYAAAEKADVLLTPEGSLSGYTHEFNADATAKALEEVTRKAREAKLALALGTCFLEPDDKQRYDQIRVYDKSGAYQGFHSKILLCRRMNPPAATGEIDHYKTKPLRTFQLDGLTIGALVCNDMWANPEWTPQDDPHLAQQLSKMGARVILHGVNAGQGEGETSDLNRQYHESNLRLRARAGKVWIAVVDAADPSGKLSAHSPSGVLDPSGVWKVRASPKGEQFFAYTIELDPK